MCEWENIHRISGKDPVGLGKELRVRQQAWLCMVMSGVCTDCYGQLSEILKGGKSCKKLQETRHYPT